MRSHRRGDRVSAGATAAPEEHDGGFWGGEEQLLEGRNLGIGPHSGEGGVEERQGFLLAGLPCP
jgi:hypothetical protein